MTQTAVFQAETIESLRRQLGDDGGELLRELIRLYLDQARELVRQIEAAGTSADGQRLRSLAHKLRGSTATLGGDRLADACLRLEEAVATTGGVAVPDGVAREAYELQQEFDDLAHELADYRQSLQPVKPARTD